MSYLCSSVLGMDQRVAGMVEAIDACAAMPLESVDGVPLLDAVIAAERTLAGLKLRLVRRLDVEEVAQRNGATSLAVWLRDRYRYTWGTARRLIATAAMVATGPVRLRDAVAAGELHLEQIEAITGTLAKIPQPDRAEVAGKLVEEAAAWDPAVLARMGALIAEALAAEAQDAEGIDGLERLERREQRDRHLSVRAARDGVGYRIDGRLTTEQAAVVNAALDPLCKPQAGDDRSRGSGGQTRWKTCAGWRCILRICRTTAVTGRRLW